MRWGCGNENMNHFNGTIVSSPVGGALTTRGPERCSPYVIDGDITSVSGGDVIGIEVE